MCLFQFPMLINNKYMSLRQSYEFFSQLEEYYNFFMKITTKFTKILRFNFEEYGVVPLT